MRDTPSGNAAGPTAFAPCCSRRGAPVRGPVGRRGRCESVFALGCGLASRASHTVARGLDGGQPRRGGGGTEDPLDFRERGPLPYCGSVHSGPGGSREAHVSTQPASTKEDPRVPQPHGDQGGPEGPQASARQGPPATHRLGCPGQTRRSRVPSGSARVPKSRGSSAGDGAARNRGSCCCGSPPLAVGPRSSALAGDSGGV